jgi:hypothetical protein
MRYKDMPVDGKVYADDPNGYLVWHSQHQVLSAEPHYGLTNGVASGLEKDDFIPVGAIKGGGQGEDGHWIKSLPAVPGPKEKSKPEFKTRTLVLEKAASDQAAVKGHLNPFFIMSNKPDDAPRAAMKPAHEMMDVFRSIEFGGGETLKIMGIHDNYKPWSRMNWRNGKPLVVTDPAAPGHIPQLFFDDYNFTKKEEGMGTYITALYDSQGRSLMDEDKSVLQAKFSAEAPFIDQAGNQPMLYTALLNKKGCEDCAVNSKDYFRVRVKTVMKKLGLRA